MSDREAGSLVSTDWLARHIDDPDIRVVDASFKLPGVLPRTRDEYQAAHIPGAVFFDIDDIADPATSLPHMLPSPDLFAAKVGALGLGDSHHIVCYEVAGMTGACRAWWSFRVFGHERVSVLDGGLTKWRREGRSVSATPGQPSPASFAPRFEAGLIRSRADMQANLSSRDEQVLDARSAARFAGSAPEPRPGLRAGHIPDSRNLDFTSLLDPATGTLKPPETLRTQLRGAGIDLATPVVTSCGSGVSAAVLAFAFYQIGCREVAVYDGSWAEWGADPALPIVTGPAR